VTTSTEIRSVLAQTTIHDEAEPEKAGA